MPNWTDHVLQVAGPQEIVDRWWKQALATGEEIGDFEPRSVHLRFTKLCAPRTRAEKLAAADHPSGLVYYRWRTWTHASVHFVCAWGTPEYCFNAPPHY